MSTDTSPDYGLPPAIVEALRHDDYDNGGADVSVTELIDSPRISAIRRLHPDKIKTDIANGIFPLIGTAVHGILQRHAEATTIAERRHFMTVAGWTLSGAIDRAIDNGDTFRIEDIKVTSVFGVGKNVQAGSTLATSESWAKQLNCYATLLEKDTGKPCERLDVIAFLRDWSKMSADKSGYPLAPVQIVPVRLFSADERMAYIMERVILHQRARADLDNTPCTGDEMWADPSKWDVMQRAADGSVAAVRRSMTKQAAERLAAEDASRYLIEVPGLRKRCETYCEVSSGCKQYAEYSTFKALRSLTGF